MIRIENVVVTGFEAAIRGMRNPMNSWDKSDSWWASPEECGKDEPMYVVGIDDLNLMQKLVGAGTDHSKFMRMITVYFDITAPMYFYKEFDTYKVGTVRNSCSTMHKITEKEFTLDDFSCENLIQSSRRILESTVKELNYCRDVYLDFDNNDYSFLFSSKKQVWYQLIQLLPSSYNQKSTICTNYAVLRNMYHARKNHKLDEWHVFCDCLKMLPYSDLITM